MLRRLRKSMQWFKKPDKLIAHGFVELRDRAPEE